MKGRLWKLTGTILCAMLLVGCLGRPNAVKPESASESANKSVAAESEPMERSESSAESELGIAEIRAMKAGSILDMNRIDGAVIEELFYSQEIQEDVRRRIFGVSYQENDVISLADLRYLRVLHLGFDGETHIGEMIVNASITEDILEIMSELYRNNYPIERMVLIDEYGADDEKSMEDNNTSAFNYRPIAGSSKLSRHSLGLAVDVNPRYNPYVKTDAGGQEIVSPANAADYIDRSQEFGSKIDETDLCCQLFKEHGFTWGGSWNSVKDYQHFEIP